MSRRLCACALAVALVGVALQAGAGSAVACPCSEFCGSVIDHGSTLSGMPWRIKAAERPPIGPQPATAEFQFSTGACGSYEGAGYTADFALPISPRFAFSAISGGGFGGAPEADLSGVTTGRAATLILRRDDGSSLTIHPRRAPDRLLRRWPWLRRVRVFDTYFAAGSKPSSLTACDVRNHVIATQAADRYFSFDATLRSGVGSSRLCEESGP